MKKKDILKNYHIKGKKGIIQLILPAVTIGMVIVIAVLFGIPLTGLTIFIIQNGTLIAIVVGLLIFLKLVSGKKS